MREKVYSFNLSDAKKYGSDCAVILYNYRFWLDKNKANKKNIHEGRVWTYNTAEALSELFPYLSEKQIYSRLKKLSDDGILIKGNFNKSPYDRTTWYSINEEEFTTGQDEESDFTKRENGSVEKVEPIPDVNTDSKPDKEKSIKNDLVTRKRTPKEFYDYQLQISNGLKMHEQYKRFVDFLYGDNEIGQRLDPILKIPKQISYKQFVEILSKAHQNKKKLSELLLKIYNNKKYTDGKRDMYLLLNNWVSETFLK